MQQPYANIRGIAHNVYIFLVWINSQVDQALSEWALILELENVKDFKCYT